MYHYAGNNPIRYIDPDGREVDATFEITSYEETKDGWMAKGILTITDLDTKKSISVEAYSGGKGKASDGVSLPLPLGEYDILEQEGNEYFFRLEANDSSYGNDQVDGINIPQGTIRLHYKGYTYGCLSVNLEKDSEDYKQFMDLIKNTNTSKVTVNTKHKEGSFIAFIHPKEKIVKFGTLKVVQSKKIVTQDNQIPHQYRKKYKHQRMNKCVN